MRVTKFLMLSGFASVIFIGFVKSEGVNALSVMMVRIRPYADLVQLVNKEHLQNIIALPDGIAREHLKNQSRHSCFRGIYATYAGQIAHTDCDGLLLFSLKHAKPEIMLIVTDHLYPLQYPGLTVQYFEVGAEARYYRYERTKSELIDKPVWRVTQVEAPKSSRLPFDAIVIFARPDELVVVAGDYLAEQGGNYLLPDVYVLPGFAQQEHALRALTVNYLMAPTRGKNKREAARIARIL